MSRKGCPLTPTIILTGPGASHYPPFTGYVTLDPACFALNRMFSAVPSSLHELCNGMCEVSSLSTVMEFKCEYGPCPVGLKIHTTENITSKTGKTLGKFQTRSYLLNVVGGQRTKMVRNGA